MSRLSRAGALTDDAIREALYLPPDVYMQKYRARKTWVKVAESKLDLESFYRAAESRARVSYRTFWSRVRAAKKRDHLNTETLDDALTLESADWVSFYGGGRHRRFVYRGELYPEHQQKAFHGIAAFLKTIGRYAEKSRIWSRMKAGWDLDMALSVPVDIRTERRGIIYKLTRIRTGQVYIGLTLGSLDQRWMLHVNSARTGAQTRLAKAIRSDGAEGFSREVIEEDIGDTRTLKAREIFFAAHFKALGPRGLNTAKPGSLSTPSGKKTEFEGEVFRSVTEAAQVLAERTGLAPHVIEARLRTGRSLPNKARKHSKHPDAGSNLFRRWLALRRRHPGGIDPAWEDSYDAFRSDVGPSFRSGLELIRKDNSQAWGPANFEWVTAQQKIENSHGKAIRINGIDYPSLRTVAESFGIGLSTLKDRLRRQGLSPEQAVAMPLGATSYRHSRERIAVDGNRFRSKRQAILYIARTRRITEHQAKHRVRRGDFL
jgi:hypothetical protein